VSDITVIINGAVADEIDKMLEHKIERVGQFAENKAKENMQGHNRSGILMASISHDVSDLTTTVGTDVEYAVPFHEGHGSFSGVPFLRDAVYNNISEIINILKG
jgi:phage gpG-like protein